MQRIAESPNFLAACFLMGKGVSHAEAVEMPQELLREYVQAFDALGALSKSEKAALAPLLSDE